MSTIPLRRLRAVATAGVVISGLSAFPASASIPGGFATASSSSTISTAADITAAATISPTTVVPARTLVDSVGVGVHLMDGKTSYANYASVKKALLDLGIRHIRDGISWDARKYLDLNQSGIKVLGTVPRKADTDTELNKVLSNAREWRPALSSIGGPNEYETTVTGWVTKLRSFQSRIFTKVNGDPALRDLPVLGPSLQTRTDETLLGDLSQYLDLGAVHAYPYGQLPEQIADDYVREAAVTSGSKPIVVTETGMANGTDAIQQQYDLSYSQRAAGIYTPRLVLEYFRLGVKRTYIYELLNRDNDLSLSPRNRYFGLLNKDFTPKPAYQSIRTLLRSLADSGTQFDTRPLSYTVNSGSALRQLTFQKSDGSYYIALWNPVSVWSGGPNGHDLYPAPVNATVNLPFTATSVQVIDLQRGLTPVKTVSGAARVAVDVGASVQLVKVKR